MTQAHSSQLTGPSSHSLSLTLISVSRNQSKLVPGSLTALQTDGLYKFYNKHHLLWQIVMESSYNINTEKTHLTSSPRIAFYGSDDHITPLSIGQHGIFTSSDVTTLGKATSRYAVAVAWQITPTHISVIWGLAINLTIDRIVKPMIM